MGSECCHHCKYEGRKTEAGTGCTGRDILFPGLELSFVAQKAEKMKCCQELRDDLWEIHYCHFGHLRRHYPDGSQLDMGHGDFSIQTARHCQTAEITLPNGLFEGLVVTLDVPLFCQNMPSLFSTAGLEKEDLVTALGPVNKVTFIPASNRTEAIFAPLFATVSQYPLVIKQIKVLELLVFILNLHCDSQEHQGLMATPEQLSMIHDLHDYLLQHLGEHITINLLAKKYLTNPTTIKRVFKEVYGTSLAAHIREHRLERAATLIKDTTDSIADIAAQVGYGSQSKFSESFKEYFGVLPTAYRRR